MSASEIELVRQRLRARIEEILSPANLAAYESYHDRLRAALSRHDPDPVVATAAEQAALDRIASDSQAAALDKQLLVLLRVDSLPQ
jgi:hypothetical protein